MKVKFNRSALQEAMTLVTSVVPSRTPKPVLHCIRLKSEDGSVLLSGTDLEVGINCRLRQVDVSEDGEVVIPADKINAIVRESVDDVLELEADDAAVHIKGADSLFTIYGHDPSQYPAVPGFDGGSDFDVSLAALQEGIELTIFAAARESTRYAINGVLWEVKGKKLTLVATDGRRLARSIVTLEGAADSRLSQQRIIVPSKAMSLLDRIGADEEARVAVRFVENKIVLACGDIVISSNLVEGNFPKYEDIIPGDYKKQITLSTDATLSAVRRAALLANEDSKGIRIELGKGKMVFTSRAPETGDAKIDMPIEYDGSPLDIGFNPQFLIDVLRVIKAASFEFAFGESDRPGLIKSGSHFLYIVMPVNI